MNKRRVVISVLVLFLICGVFLAGFGFAYLKFHHTYEVIDEKSMDFLSGKVHLKHVFEGDGLLFLETEKSVAELDDGMGMSMLLYKARRSFQEPDPHVKEVSVHHNELSWEDGWNQYQLTVRPTPRKKAPANAKGAP